MNIYIFVLLLTLGADHQYLQLNWILAVGFHRDLFSDFKSFLLYPFADFFFFLRKCIELFIYFKNTPLEKHDIKLIAGI